MADGITVDNGTLTDYVASTDEVTIAGLLAHVQRMKLVDGTDGGTDVIPGSTANGLDVDVTRITSPVASGTITALDGFVQLKTDGAHSVGIQVTGIWDQELVCEGSYDGVTWTTDIGQIMWDVRASPAFIGHMTLGQSSIGGASRNGHFRVDSAPFLYVRLRARNVGGVPGTASVVLVGSATPCPLPTTAYQMMIFDGVAPTSAKVSPAMPHPPFGWDWDNSQTLDAGTLTGMSQTTGPNGLLIKTEYADDPTFPAAATWDGGDLDAWTMRFTAGISAAEDAAHAKHMYMANWLRFRYYAAAYSTGSGKYTVYASFVKSNADSPATIAPSTADQSSASGDVGQLPNYAPSGPAGRLPLEASLLVAKDAAANTNGGKYRMLRVDASQRLIVQHEAGLPAGTNNIGKVDPNAAPEIALNVTGTTIPQSPPASGGVGTVHASGAAAVAATALVSAPGAGLSIYVTDMEGSNEGTAKNTVSLYEGTAVRMFGRSMGADGGGFATNLKTPWKLPANTALGYAISAAQQYYLTVSYYIAP